MGYISTYIFQALQFFLSLLRHLSDLFAHIVLILVCIKYTYFHNETHDHDENDKFSLTFCNGTENIKFMYLNHATTN